jgi:hypothetical protein
MENVDVNNVNLIVETAILDIANGNSAYKSGMAIAVHAEMSKTRGANAATSIFHALYKASLRNAIDNGHAEEKAKEIGEAFKPRYYNISYYGFLQNVMDKICWNVRKGATKRLDVDELEQELDNANGIDFAADYAEEQGFNAESQAMIKSEIEHVHSLLEYTAVKIAAKLRVSNAQPLYLFAPSTLKDGEWVNEIKTDDWDEAMSYMAEIAKQLQAADALDESDLNEPFALEDDPRMPSQERLEALQSNLSNKRVIKRNAKAKAA